MDLYVKTLGEILKINDQQLQDENLYRLVYERFPSLTQLRFNGYKTNTDRSALFPDFSDLYEAIFQDIKQRENLNEEYKQINGNVFKNGLFQSWLTAQLLDETVQIVQFKPRFPYDMTYYINHPDIRYKDSVYFNRLFEYEWQKFKEDSSNIDKNYQDVPFRQTFHGSRRACSFLRTPDEIVQFYFKLEKIESPNNIKDILDSSIQVVVPFFSHIKKFIHGKFDEVPPIAYLYAELDTIAGYPLQEHRAMNDDPYLWLTQDVPDLHDPKWWADSIQMLLSRSARIPTEPLIGFVEFVKKPWLWVTSGASTESNLYLNGAKVKTKFGAAVSLTTEQLLASVFHAIDPNSTNIDIFIKPDERGFKRRLIANMDLGSYLIAAYIRYLIEYLDGSNPHWMTATTTPRLDAKVINLLKAKRRAIPADESQFDHHLSRSAWLGFCLALQSLFPDNFGVQLFNLMFSNSQYFDRESSTVGKWLKGMPSGLAITAIGNTIFNYIKQSYIQSPIHFALGDDVLVFNENVTLKQLEEYYKTFGAELNAKKNWTSRKYAEYLHFLYCDHGRVGYPSRVYGSLMFALSFTDTTPLQRINELTTLWKDFFDRSCLPMDQNLVAADLARAVSARWHGFSAEVAKTWLHIPKALNGFGLLPYVYINFNVTNDETVREYYTGNLIKLPRLYKVTRSSFTLDKFTFSRSSYRCGNELRLPKISTISEWEDMLEGKIPGFTPHMCKYGQGTIPLPEMDYVSTSRMSGFAAMFKFNQYLNSFGNIIHRTNRFISASIGLSILVSQFMKREGWLVYV